jgi:uncharacterized protein (TIGR02118 family)
MVKALYLIRRKPGMSVADFHRYWLEVHGPIAARIPGARRYVQSHALDRSDDEGRAYDGAAEVWFDDMAALERAGASAEYAAARADEKRFIDLEHTVLVLTEEAVIVPASES